MREYLDDSKPWRFDEMSMIELDENDHTVMDVWKVVRKINDRCYYSLALKVAPLNKMLEIDGEWYGVNYNINGEVFAQAHTIGLFCFLHRGLAIDFGQKVMKKKSWNIPGSPLYIMRGKGILRELLRPKRIVRTMQESVIRQYYKRYYFNKDTLRWKRKGKWDPYDNFESKRLTTNIPGVLFAGFKSIEAEPVPLPTELDPEFDDLFEKPDPNFDPDDPEFDFIGR